MLQSFKKYPHSYDAVKYANHVVKGHKPACQEERQACQRFLDDLTGDIEYVYDVDRAEKACRFIEKLKHTKGKWAAQGQKLVLEPWQKFIVCNLFGWVDGDGKRRFRHAYLKIPRKNGKSLMAAAIGVYMFVADGEFGAEVYCLDPSTLVLCDDLSWRPVGELEAGQGIVAFDEHPPKRPETYRKFRHATVVSNAKIDQPCYRIRFDDGGETVASAGHKWLCKRAPVGMRQDWSETEKLYKGSRIRYFGKPWTTDETRTAGYLAGIYDGEGCVANGKLKSAHRTGFRVSVAQRPGTVLDQTRTALDEKGFSYTERSHAKSGVHSLDMQSAYECFRLLGSIRPERLIEKAPQLYEGRALNRGQCWRTVASVEYVGVQTVSAIETSTGTLLADGMFSHNSGATTEKQAWEVFGPARLICKRLPDLCDHYGVEVNAKNMNVLADASKFEPLIGNPGDGASPSCAIVDEYHEHATSDQVDTMLTGMGAREQPLLLEITTAGNNYSGPCYDAEVEYKKLLAKVYQDDRTFVQIFGIDQDDDWTTEAALIKANPNYDISVSAEFLKGQQEAAKRNPSKQNAFKRKHLNVWVGAANAWINMEDWAKCKDVKMTVEDFKDEPCTVILDLASRLDITAKIKLWSRTVKGKKHYYVFPTFYLPEETVHEGGNDHYQSWVNGGHMIATDGEEIDFNEIEADVEQDLSDFDMREVVYDPWRAVQLAQGLAERGALTVEWRGTPANNSPAMRELEAAITGKRLHHPDNPVLNWMASNIVAREGTAETLMPKKEKPENKIDGIVAIIMGIGRLMHGDEPEFDVDAMLASEPVRIY